MCVKLKLKPSRENWDPLLDICCYSHSHQISLLYTFHSAKREEGLVDSWSRAPDQIQMYSDRDTIDCFHCHAVKNKSKTIQWIRLRNFDVIEDNELSHFSKF